MQENVMSVRMVVRALLVCVGGLGVGTCSSGAGMNPPSHDDIAGKATLTANASELKSTEIVADYEHGLAEGRSTIWCSTMQLAWNELGSVMGAPVAASGGSGGAAGMGMVAALNQSKVSRQDLDDGSYVAMGGFGKDDILGKIRAALQERFKGAASPKILPGKIGPGEIYAYAYLFKNLEFATPFMRRKVALEFGGKEGKKVAAFGVWSDDRVQTWSEMVGQVSILKYESPKDWTVELKSKATQDRLIISRRERGKTLAETVTAAMGVPAGSKPETMNHADRLVVPLLNFDLTREYSELSGVQLQGSKASGPVLSAAQNIRFRLDERGAVLKSEAGLKAGAAVQPKVREMVCDGPFLIVMMRAGAERPYFAMWVETGEVLVGF